MDTMSAREAAVLTAGKRSADDEVLAQTMMILAAGAMEWTHCKSKEASADHEAEMGVDGSSPGIDCPPFWSIFLKQPLAVVQAGSPNLALKTAKSFSAIDTP